MHWLWFFAGFIFAIIPSTLLFMLVPELAEELHQKFQKWLDKGVTK